MTREFTEITVIGEDKTGLIARVTSLLFERNVNVEDLDQAVREGLFRMTMHVDTAEMTDRVIGRPRAAVFVGSIAGLD